MIVQGKITLGVAASVDGLDELIAACVVADGHAPFEEHTMLTLDGANQLPHSLFTYVEDAGLAGCAVLSEGVAGWAVELAVHPVRRGEGLGRALLAAAVEHVGSHGGGTLRGWVHGGGRAQEALARGLRARTERRLLVLQRSLEDLPVTRCHDGVLVHRLDPSDDADRDAWLELSNAAFLGHPENGGWGRADLDWRMSAPWTDGARFPVASDAFGLAAGVWTKRDPGSADGELYVVAVHPRAQGRGLGRLVVAAAMRDLRDQGCQRSLLYVDADNAPARSLYGWAGYTPGAEHCCLAVDIAPAVLRPAAVPTAGLPRPA